MATQDKVIAGILVAHGLLGAAWTYSAASQLGFPALFLISNLALVAIGITAGICCFKGFRWAALLGMLFFAIQLLHVATPSFRFSFTLGLNFIISFGWFGSGQIGINLFALAMLLWVSFRVRAPNSSFKADASGAA
jgi:hypothetical protein